MGRDIVTYPQSVKELSSPDHTLRGEYQGNSRDEGDQTND